jgi:hypothetical protein
MKYSLDSLLDHPRYAPLYDFENGEIIRETAAEWRHPQILPIELSVGVFIAKVPRFARARIMNNDGTMNCGHQVILGKKSRVGVNLSYEEASLKIEFRMKFFPYTVHY